MFFLATRTNYNKSTKRVCTDQLIINDHVFYCIIAWINWLDEEVYRVSQFCEGFRQYENVILEDGDFHSLIYYWTADDL